MFGKKHSHVTVTPSEMGDQIHRLSEDIGRSMAAIVRHSHADLNRMPLLNHISELGPVSLSDLARAGQVSRPTMSESLRKLVTSGLVDRHRDPGDRRSVLFALTGKGAARLELAKRTHQAAIEGAMAGADETNLAVLEMAMPIVEDFATRLRQQAEIN